MRGFVISGLIVTYLLGLGVVLLVTQSNSVDYYGFS